LLFGVRKFEHSTSDTTKVLYPRILTERWRG
jgi:hypothetical protein